MIDDKPITTMTKLPEEIVKERFDLRVMQMRIEQFKKEKLRAQDGA